MICSVKNHIVLCVASGLLFAVCFGCDGRDNNMAPVAPSPVSHQETGYISGQLPNNDGPAAKLTVSENAVAGRAERAFSYVFDGDPQGWIGDFVDVPVDHEDQGFNLMYDPVKPLPTELNDGRAVPFLSSVNRSDDVFMYLRRRIEGLKPHTTYQVGFQVQFGTNVAGGLIGVGGAPGESVFVRVGVSLEEPAPVVVSSEDYFRLGVEKGNQSADGPSDVVIGNVVKPTSEEPEMYEIKKLNNRYKPLSVTTDSSGAVWIFVGTDSGFESLTEIYYSRISLVFTQQPS